MNNKLLAKNPVFIYSVSLAILNSMLISLCIPVLPQIAIFFQVSSEKIQFSLTVFLFFIGMSQLIWGPCFDYLDFRFTLFISFFLILIGTLLILFSDTFLIFVVGRILEAIGVGGLSVSLKAILVIYFENKNLSKALSLYMLLTTIFPLSIPIIGGSIGTLKWKIIFFALLFLSIILLLFTLYITRNFCFNNKYVYKNSIKHCLIEYKRFLMHKKFISCLLILVGIYLFQVIYLLSLPFLLSSIEEKEPFTIGLYLSFPVIFEILSITSINLLEKYISTSNFIKIGLFFITIGTILLFILNNFHLPILVSVILPVSISIFGGGLVFIKVFNIALAIFKENKGMASALTGITQQIGAGSISSCLFLYKTMNQIGIAISYAGCVFLMLILYYYNLKDDKNSL
jgi:DHA1 family bicyclomycin/chloramphenicol resistance-like MFS transporter